MTSVLPEDIEAITHYGDHSVDDDFKHAGHVELEEGIKAIPTYDVASEMQRAAEYRSHQNIGTVNATDAILPQQCLPQARRRHRAVISSRPILTGETPEYVVIGSREQVDKGQGFRLWNGQSYVIESSPALYIGPGTTPPTHTIDVNIFDERYE